MPPKSTYAVVDQDIIDRAMTLAKHIPRFSDTEIAEKLNISRTQAYYVLRSDGTMENFRAIQRKSNGVAKRHEDGKKGHPTKINQQLIDNVFLLKERFPLWSQEKIAEAVGLSGSTVSLILKTDGTLEDYHSLAEDRFAALRVRKAEQDAAEKAAQEQAAKEESDKAASNSVEFTEQASVKIHTYSSPEAETEEPVDPVTKVFNELTAIQSEVTHHGKANNEAIAMVFEAVMALTQKVESIEKTQRETLELLR